jgi:hypothetical protein
LTGVGDAGGKAVFAGCGARGEIAAETGAAEDQAFRIDFGDGQREIDDGANWSFPIGPHWNVLVIEHSALAGSVEQQAVIAAARGGYGAGEIHVGDCRVETVGEDDGGALRTRSVGGWNEVGGHRCAFERDALRNDRRIEKSEACVESGDLFVVGGEEKRVDWLAVERVVGANVKGAGAEVEVAGGGEVAGFFCFFGLRKATIAGGDPRFVESVSVTVSDGCADRLDFCEFGTAGGNVGERPASEFVEQVVFEEKARLILRDRASYGVGRCASARELQITTQLGKDYSMSKVT